MQGIITDQPVPFGGQGHDGGSRAVTVEIGDHLGFPAVHERHAGIRGAQVNADDEPLFFVRHHSTFFPYT